MLFQIKKPCDGCPFRRDLPPYLTGARARGIANVLRDDERWFACHMTTPQGTGRRIPKAKQSHCAGAMMVLARSGLCNVAMRLAHAFKLIDIVKLAHARAPVFRNLQEFEAHHARSDRA